MIHPDMLLPPIITRIGEDIITGAYVIYLFVTGQL